MSNFALARKNMVDCQIQTVGVASPPILEAFERVPREIFVPKDYEDVSYISEDLIIKDGSFLLEPSTHARMLEALDIQPDSVLLDIGLSCGYAAAIASALASTVVSVDSRKSVLDKADKAWNSLGTCNIAAVKGPLVKGWPAEAPYNHIFIGGACAEIPEKLIKQLVGGGKLIFIEKQADEIMGRAMLVRKNDEGESYSTLSLFEAAAPYVPGFEPKEEFAF